MAEGQTQKPLELILARNLLTSISTPAFLVDSDASIVFYNEAAAALLGRSFEDAGRMTAEEWTHPYSRRTAAFPAGLHTGPLYADGFDKYWPPVGRIDQGYGDRHLVCTCPPPEAFED